MMSTFQFILATEYTVGAGEAVIIAAVTAAAVAAVGVVVQWKMGLKSLRHVSALEVARLSIEFKMRQLNECYGPMVIQIDKSKTLYGTLKAGKPDEWHFLNSIQLVKQSPADRALFESIMEANAEIESILMKKSGLLRRGRDTMKLVKEFLAHFDLVKRAYAGEQIHPIAGSDYYPKDFDNKMKNAFDAIQDELATTLRRHEACLKAEEAK